MYLSLYVVSCAIDRVRGREGMHKEGREQFYSGAAVKFAGGKAQRVEEMRKVYMTTRIRV